ncbi:MAG: MFS transporter [Acidiferrobacterales bacterium]
MTSRTYPPSTLAWSVWGLAGILYLIGFYQRVAPAVMTDELTADFALDATTLGSLSAFYFYSYVIMQIPTGILADRLGPKNLLTLGALVTGLGTYVFATATIVLWAELGRLLIGGGVAVAFVCMLKLADHWLAPKHYALATGIALCFGIIGAVFAGVPLRIAIDAYGWREVMFFSATLPFGVAALIWCLVRNDPTERGYRSYGHVRHAEDTPFKVMAGLKRIFQYRNTWILSLLPGSVVGSVLTFSGLWGVPFLTTHYGLSKTSAAAIATSVLVAWAVSGPILGAWSDRLGKRKPLYAISLGALVPLWGVLLFVPNLPVPLLISLLLAIGLMSGCMIIGFAFAKESVPRALSGTVSGVVNMGVMLGPMLLQPGVGFVLDRYGATIGEGGSLRYSLTAYQAGFSLMLVWLLVGFALILFSRETHCRHYEYRSGAFGG